MHLHASAMQALVIFAMLIPAFVGWRILSAHWADNNAGKAMAFVF